MRKWIDCAHRIFCLLVHSTSGKIFEGRTFLARLLETNYCRGYYIIIDTMKIYDIPPEVCFTIMEEIFSQKLKQKVGMSFNLSPIFSLSNFLSCFVFHGKLILND